jgi:uncharacterized membrane protein YdfJ with MMPL/SSD domain
LVEWCRRHAWAVVALALAATLACGWVAATRLSLDTDTDRLLSPKLEWRQREIAFDKEFPQNSNLIAVVVDGPTPEQAETATAALAARLKAETGLFTSVVRPDGGPYFDRYGLLLLPVEDVQTLADSLIRTQALLGNVAADPSLRGLADTLTLALQGIKQGAVERETLLPALDAMSDAVAANLDPAKPLTLLSWQAMLTGQKPTASELRRFIQVKPVLDYSSLTPGERAWPYPSQRHRRPSHRRCGAE